MRYHGLLVGAVVLLLGAAPASDDLKKLQGTWSLVKGEKGSKGIPDDDVGRLKFVFKDNTITVQDGKRDEAAEFKIDPAKKPKQIDIFPDKGAKAEVLGIYELDGDNLKISWNKGGGTRPPDFKTLSDIVLVLKRDK